MYIIGLESAYLLPVLFYQFNWMRNPEGTTKFIQDFFVKCVSDIRPEGFKLFFIKAKI